MKKLLLISSFFPPSAKAGSHRAIILAEHLPSFGWEPVFITRPIDGYYGSRNRIDSELLKKVNKFKIYRITPFFSAFGKHRDKKWARLFARFWEYIWLPDSRVIWNNAIKSKLKEIIKTEKPDAVFISATPFSTFLLSKEIKLKYNLPVILDYRDPWTDNSLTQNTFLRKITGNWQERKAAKYADLITTASFYISKALSNNNNIRSKIPIFSFPYGFDEILSQEKKSENNKLKFCFAGSVHGKINPEIILKAFAEFINRNPNNKNIEIICFGSLFGGNYEKFKNFIEQAGLKEYLKFNQFIPYEEFKNELSKSDILMLPHGDTDIAQLLYPTKFFDYLSSKKPILYIGGEGQVWETITDLNAGVCVKPKQNEIVKGITKLVKNNKEDLWYDTISSYEKFYRINIVKDFVDQLNTFVIKK